MFEYIFPGQVVIFVVIGTALQMQVMLLLAENGNNAACICQHWLQIANVRFIF